MRESPKNRAIPRSPTIPPTSAHPHTRAVEGPLSPYPISFLSHHLRSAFKARPERGSCEPPTLGSWWLSDGCSGSSPSEQGTRPFLLPAWESWAWRRGSVASPVAPTLAAARSQVAACLPLPRGPRDNRQVHGSRGLSWMDQFARAPATAPLTRPHCPVVSPGGSLGGVLATQPTLPPLVRVGMEPGARTKSCSA